MPNFLTNDGINRGTPVIRTIVALITTSSGGILMATNVWRQNEKNEGSINSIGISSKTSSSDTVD